MEFSISALLTSFTEDKLVAPKVLEKKLVGEDTLSLRQLQITLDALERVGILTKERGKYRRISEEGVVEGKLRCSSKGFCFAIQEGEEAEDIYIRESQLNTAWNGDRVLVKVTKEGRRRRSPEGEVRLILERANPSVIARVKQVEESYRAVPLDDRLLFELELHPQADGPDLAEAVDQLVHVEILRYPLGSKLPIGQVTQILGSDAQSAADTELVFCKYDLPRDFGADAIAAAQDSPTPLSKSDLKNRLDLQKQFTVVIAEAEDALSEGSYALSLERNKAGQWQLGVHLSDVATYVPTDSALSQGAWQRGTSIRLGKSWVPLLPIPFIEQVGCLPPGEARLAISLLVTLSEAGEVTEFEVQPSAIQVNHRLTYAQTRELLAAEKATTKEQKNLLPLLHHLQTLSQALRERRLQRGSFDLCLPQPVPAIALDEGRIGVPIQAGSIQALVAEFLILANELIIGHLTALGVPTLYRIQSPPDVQDVQDLLKLASNVGATLTLAQEETVQPQDYQAWSQAIQASTVSPVLNEMAVAALPIVQYSQISGPHFGLAQVQAYGQISSPLHRYGDLLNQRVLHAVFAQGRDRRSSRAKERVNLRHSSCHGQINWNVLPPDIHRDLEAAIVAAVPHLNECDQLAQQAEQDLVGLQKTKTMQERTGQVFPGIITGIQSYGFFVRIEGLMVEGLVHVSSLKDDWYEYRSRQQTLIGRKNRRQYRLGDRVEVEVKSVDYYRQQIDLMVVSGGSEATEAELADEDVTDDVLDLDTDGDYEADEDNEFEDED
ncbi:RNB domain-containing ribonuclease [Synechococcales cyanobacterium C]|uniref:RNB domain-containing ribonuclease n=1 Tax=Petrachloros mirabilis ULC683 TaxID=2781853 RepID=A0A8K2A0Q5_9CYAN|nr:ribonuclease R family protein [Petrachloros mirabilis]NCJ07632.1 RNB domain-containing ribonuclease [Petrachloros mirabilis ULC683]